jgi:hypothetical protein
MNSLSFQRVTRPLQDPTVTDFNQLSRIKIPVAAFCRLGHSVNLDHTMVGYGISEVGYKPIAST